MRVHFKKRFLGLGCKRRQERAADYLISTLLPWLCIDYLVPINHCLILTNKGAHGRVAT